MMPTLPVLPLLLASVFFLLALIHIYWACGGQAWLGMAVPERPAKDDASAMEKAFQPGKAGTFAVGLALLTIAGMAALRGGLLGAAVQHPALRVALAVVAATMLLRAIGEFRLVGFFKKIKGTRFARMDSLLYSPLCCALGLGLAVLAL